MSDYHTNTTCKVCGKTFHWCTSCSCVSDQDYARDAGYCSVACACEANPAFFDWSDEADDDEQ